MHLGLYVANSDLVNLANLAIGLKKLKFNSYAQTVNKKEEETGHFHKILQNILCNTKNATS